MNKFHDLNYYEILEIPVTASPFEIKRAYKNAIETYNHESLLTYSLFSDEERANILRKVDDAYNTLIDRTKRMVYDASLIDEATAANSQQDFNRSLAFPDSPSEKDSVGDKNEGCLPPGGESQTGRRPQHISVSSRAGRSRINPARISEHDLDRRSVENEDISVRKSFWGQLSQKIFLILLLVVLILIALAVL